MTLTQYLDIMREEWWLCLEEDNDKGITTDQLMTGFQMLEAIRSAESWDDPVIEEAPYITAKDTLMTICDVLGVEWEDLDDWNAVFNRLEKFIENIEE